MAEAELVAVADRRKDTEARRIRVMTAASAARRRAEARAPAMASASCEFERAGTRKWRAMLFKQVGLV